MSVSGPSLLGWWSQWACRPRRYVRATCTRRCPQPHTLAQCCCLVGEGAAPATVVATIVVRLARVAAETARRARWRMNEPALLWNQEFE
jgi:hypothetical protein